MPITAALESRPATWMVDHSALGRWQIKGGDAVGWLRAHDIDAPADFFARHALSETGAFIARTGSAEYFLHDDARDSVATRLGEVPDALVAGTRILPRDDLELVLGGAAATGILAELCMLDLADERGRFCMTRIAKVSTWLCVEGDPDAPGYRIGCEPSHGDYLFETLLERVHEAGGGLIGFHDYAYTQGDPHDP
jgi:sarcosine oxidase subunit gamma